MQWSTTMSSSVDDLHPGFKNETGPVTPVSPSATFVRKRSHPAISTGKKQQHFASIETVPLYSSLESAPALPPFNVSSAASHANSRQTQSYAPTSGHVPQVSGYSPPRKDLDEKGVILQHDEISQHVQTMGKRLTFYQRHFTKPVNKDRRDEDSNKRR